MFSAMRSRSLGSEPGTLQTMKSLPHFISTTFDGTADFEACERAEVCNEEVAIDVACCALAKLRQELPPQEVDLVPDAFLQKCLVQHYWAPVAAKRVLIGFLQFRKAVGWPYRIPAHSIARALRTGMHWLFREQIRKIRLPWSGGGGDEVGPAACLVYNAARLDPAVCSVEEYQKMGTYLMERATDSPATQARGVALILDCFSVELAPILKILNMEDIRRGVLMWKGAFPCRLRRIWIVDAPLGAQPLATAVLQLLHPHVRERVRFARRRWRCNNDSMARTIMPDPGLKGLAEDLSMFDLPAGLGGTGIVDWDAQVDSYLKEDLAAELAEKRIISL
eukprot:gnl/TRDRNA2_/TRDRNA2_35151_c0_seq1.p1 gnl/TRDRNA2_/TRDRNA2_35151_c0~~gnl/TRDRNA2_/TRDRNA2_35151_c0_seq1.p1  ORF type:complete len:336 (+),score=45.86 gnl/TRDRNA2_/TRDRNA2_35151_c0_seq1:69-1076(+)